ncbi:hypothetical protein BK140_29785 [Paenibacillus macerans]|nr:hypothetical protein BK140_29785 [Paenibacillus macerans]
MRAGGRAAKRAADAGWRTGGQAGCRCRLADGRPSRQHMRAGGRAAKPVADAGWRTGGQAGQADAG